MLQYSDRGDNCCRSNKFINGVYTIRFRNIYDKYVFLINVGIFFEIQFKLGKIINKERYLTYIKIIITIKLQ